jgi:hypothetical protein
MERCIPRRIIQTGRSRDLPLLQRAVVANIKLLNPEFEYCFFDDDGVRQFLDREFPEYRAAFDAFPYHIQKYDFFRYLAVYRYGGFYLDLDVLLASGLSSLVDRGCIFPFDDLNTSAYLRRQHRMDWTVGNYAFGATAGHPFLKAAIDNCIRGQEHPEWVEPSLRGIPHLFRDDFVVLNTTGPLMLSRTLAENAGLVHEVEILFPDDVRSPDTWHKFGAVGVHLMEGSWRRRESLVRRRLRMLWEARVFHRFMKESAKLGAVRCALPA